MPKNRNVTEQEALEFLQRGTYGVLSLASPDGTPYGVPLNYVYVPEDNAVYFHCAKTGKKLDLLRQNAKASFAVVPQETILQERFTTHYDCVLVTGTAALIEDETDKRAVLTKLCARLTPNFMPQSAQIISQYLPAVAIVRLSIESVAGKRNRDD